MRVVYMHLALATWLLLSAFTLGHTPLTGTATVVAAGIVMIAAIASLGRPPVRYVIAVASLALAIVTILLPSSGPAAISNLLVAAVLFALSLISPRHGEATHAPRAA